MSWTILKKAGVGNRYSNRKSRRKLLSAPQCRLSLLDPAINAPEGTEFHIKMAYLDFGSDGDCFISYGEEFPMVSRMHAAIELSNNSFNLRHLSATHPTLLNGKTINRKGFLKDGDVIQLAPSGPKIRFNTIDVARPSQRPGLLNPYQLRVILKILIAVMLLSLLMYWLT